MSGGNGAPPSTGDGAALHRDLAPDLGLPPWTRVQVLDGAGELAVTAGLWTTGALVTALDRRGTASLALAGGSTPRHLYRVLSGPFRWHVDWGKVHFFQGDERAVPPDDPSSNFRMAREDLLSRLGVDDDHVHRMAGELDPEEAARRYETELRATLGEPPRLDLVLLGLGDDGHTASLFPAAFQGHGDDPGHDPHPDRRVAPGEAPAPPRGRITLTLSTLAAARQVLFLVTGEGKARAVQRTFAALRAFDRGELPEGPIPPAARVRPGRPAEAGAGGSGDGSAGPGGAAGRDAARGGTGDADHGNAGDRSAGEGSAGERNAGEGKAGAADPGEAGEDGTVRWLLDRSAFALAGFHLDAGGAAPDDDDRHDRHDRDDEPGGNA